MGPANMQDHIDPTGEVEVTHILWGGEYRLQLINLVNTWCDAEEGEGDIVLFKS
jgi:hypothetical protein